MNRKLLLVLLTAFLAVTASTDAAEDDPPPPPTNRPSPEELRSRLRHLSPADREARLREWRARSGGATNRSELEKRREEWRNLPPAEREARLREWRERNLDSRSPKFNRLTPAEREAKRTEIKGRVEGQIKELESRQAIAPLSPLDQRRLERFRQMSRRLEQGTALGSTQRKGANTNTSRPARRDQPTQPPP